ncbi:MAG: hypothetical protein HC849_22375 [Oscillatoriales cyanobacterium RU_3_3]|nr:hypothetical protein [Microcoleus sp. SU_5_3]NJL66120.1 hypothetical protein [Microcoleus sp. SM1_3_4]NJM62324.1 hypothetical protein [Oscillatoriales cyanobacterium RU_3_3]NJR24047.1 hypothetical protein [Richelia sp. CSU_2_1]
MTTVTQAQIEQYRSQLQEYPDALKGLDVLAECEGDLEYAAETIAIESGELQDNLSEEDPNEPSWLEKSTQKLRPYICTSAFRESLRQGFNAAMAFLMPYVGIPALLILIVIYINEKNLDEFCKDC